MNMKQIFRLTAVLGLLALLLLPRVARMQSTPPAAQPGAKLTATILREMERSQLRYGMVTMCVGGGQGAAGIFERL